MSLNNLLAAVICMTLGACCHVEHATRSDATPSAPSVERLKKLLVDYCWSGQHFANVDFAKAAFIQFVNDDFVIYRLTEAPGEMLYCAFPADNRGLIERAKAHGIPYAVYRSVTP